MRIQLLSFLFLIVFNTTLMHAQAPAPGHYAAVNGLQLYYELHGSGKPLVLLHGGGSTINATYGRVLQQLAAGHRVIAIELQAHGRTKDIDRPLSFEQDADDVAALLQQLHIAQADFMGFSNGATTCLQLAIRHPQLVSKLVLASVACKRSGLPPGFFESMEHATFDQMPQPLKDAYLEENPGDQQGLLAMFWRDVKRMQTFKDISDEAIKAIQAPALIINGYRDVTSNEQVLTLSHTLPHAQLVILPGGHGDYIGEICAPDKTSRIPELTVVLIDEFLKQ